tara:strand:- start:2507 stop:2797 length:291 start_codon:yes stop_codon:yes gene_type:complete
MLHKTLAHGWNQVKSFVGGHYQRLGKFASEFDRLAGVGRKAFSLVAPILEDMGQGHAVQQGVKAVQQYDTVRKGIMDADGYARHHGRRIAEADLFD